MAWSDTFQSAFDDVIGAGASVLKAKAEAAGRTNNAPVTSNESALQKWQPMVMIAVAGLAVVLVFMLAKRR